jgi:hypothetical protein
MSTPKAYVVSLTSNLTDGGAQVAEAMLGESFAAFQAAQAGQSLGQSLPSNSIYEGRTVAQSDSPHAGSPAGLGWFRALGRSRARAAASSSGQGQDATSSA